MVLAWGITVYAYSVSEQQEPTYSPVVEQKETATTTQPAEETASTTMLTKDVVVEKIKERFPDAPIMLYVAECESGLNVDANRDGLDVDVGLFQINQIHNWWFEENGKSRWDIDDNLEYARILYDKNGLRDWYKSEGCWSKYL